MVVIRLSRSGAKRRPFFNIVVMDSRSRRDGQFIERLGYYNPKAGENEETTRIDNERVDHWVGHGAQVSDTVKRILRTHKRQAAKAA